MNAVGALDVNAERFLPHLIAASEAFLINNPRRVAAWLAQIGHESKGLSVLVENLNYSAKALLATFPKYFNADTAKEYARKPEMIANRVYGGRMGNNRDGDGWKFRGRGLLQTTGRLNYSKLSVLGEDFTAKPELLEQPKYAALSAAYFWESHGLNVLADKDMFVTITQRINGGMNGYAHRVALWNAVKERIAEEG